MLSPKSLKDAELLVNTQSLVQKERTVTLDILRHLQEVERRKLYCDVRRRAPLAAEAMDTDCPERSDGNGSAPPSLNYGSLFDYAVGELGYSEGAAARRIQAMRLMTEIPEVAPKIESGALNLSTICQAQNFFRDLGKAEPERVFRKEDKREVLAQLEQKSAREGQRILLAMGGPAALPRERERAVSPAHTEVRFLVTTELHGVGQD
jgi:hypothetical protein